VQEPPQNGGGQAAFYGSWSGTGSAPASPSTPVPVPRNMSSYGFRREVSTGVNNYTLWYCR
jgi:hypothetical protein